MSNVCVCVLNYYSNGKNQFDTEILKLAVKCLPQGLYTCINPDFKNTAVLTTSRITRSVHQKFNSIKTTLFSLKKISYSKGQ